jgi:flagellar P-ring protein precursor FlgI
MAVLMGWEMEMKRTNRITWFIGLLILHAGILHAARIKDITWIKGVRGNHLSGMGLVVGLAGTGDSTQASAQALASLLRRQDGLTFPPTMLASGNIAQVMVTAELGPWDQEGSPIDIDVSAVGNTMSLQGGILLPTELKGADGQVYAVARSGAISTASWTVEGQTGSKVAKNHSTVGRIPNGAYVERAEPATFIEVIGGRQVVTLLLKNADLTTAQRIEDEINRVAGDSAKAKGPGSVQICIPKEVPIGEELKYLGKIMTAEVEVDLSAKVVINEKTGTIVAGGNVGISEVAISQGSLVIKMKEQPYVSQPIAPFTESATTAVVQNTTISVEEQEGHLIRIPKVVSVSELVDALNAIGATPRDLIAIFNALNRAGALQAELITM